MYYKCIVNGCKSLRQDVKFHQIPETLPRQKKWLMILGITNKSASEIRNTYVCHKHFEKRFVTPKLRLVCDAYPSLFTPEEISSGRPSTENTDPLGDHNYTSRKRHRDHTYVKRVSPLLENSQGNILGVIDINQPSTSHCNPILEKDDHSPNTSDVNHPKGTVPNPSTSQSTKNILHEVSLTSTIEKEINDGNKTATSVTPKVTKISAKKNQFKKISNLPPQCREIHRLYKNAKRCLSATKRAKKAMQFAKDQILENKISKLNVYGKIMLKMQINQCGKKEKGRRFSMEEKVLSLAIHKQSPKCYHFLQKIFILPSKTTLNKFISKMNIGVGINTQVFEVLKKEVATWKDQKKYCSLIFDEMSLETNVAFKNDKIIGLVELEERAPKFADHALVFMLRGAIHKWQQPLAFYFCEGATSAAQLKPLMAQLIKAIVEVGLKPVAVVCDQGSAFQSAINMFARETKVTQQRSGAEIDDGVVVINDVKLSIIYDPSHLIKGLRNNFLNKDLKLGSKVAKWQDIVEVYRGDCNHTEIRLLHKLNDQHVIPEKIKKMKVKNCVRVFSKTMVAALLYTTRFSHYANGRPVSDSLRTTAEAVNFFDDLFDSVNGASYKEIKKGKKLRIPVSENSEHVKFWKEAIEKFKTMKYINNEGQEKSVPTLRNWVTTLKSYLRLWEFFQKIGVKVMRPRYFNSDPIENFFGQVRQYNFRNNDPDCETFKNTFKSLLVTRFLNFHKSSFNCEDDWADQILNIKNLFDARETVETSAPPTQPRFQCAIEANIRHEASKERLSIHSRAYTTGWVVRKTLTKNKCKKCHENLTSKVTTSVHDWISQREYKKMQNSLCYPSEIAVRRFGDIVNVTNEYLENYCHMQDITENIKKHLFSEYSFDFINCPSHSTETKNSFVNITIKLQVHNWCSVINGILKGKDISRLENRSLPAMQNKAFNKFKRKLKNKRINK